MANQLNNTKMVFRENLNFTRPLDGKFLHSKTSRDLQVLYKCMHFVLKLN